jgi:3-oxoacyl-[acyl-carrier-protein] synthase-1
MGPSVSDPSITGLGLVSCVGHDVITACAAQRAGLVRRAPVPDLVSIDEDDEELEAPVMGAPVTPLTDGFIQTGRWIQLALACLEDLQRTAGAPEGDAAFWRDTALLWVVPPIDQERFGWPDEEVPGILEQSCGDLLRALTGLELKAPADAFFPLGQTGAAAALARATELLVRREAERVAILSTDSWLDPQSAGALASQGRLRTPEVPVGLCPGEAAAAILLESREALRRREASAAAVVLGTAGRPAPRALDEEDPAASRTAMVPATGRRLAEAVREVLRGQPFSGDLILDLNGEEWRAHVWGHALTHLARELDLDRCRQVIPAVSWGDIGAASGPAGMCIAARAFSRGYAGGERALVCSVSDACDVSAILLGAPIATAGGRD